MQHDRDNPPAFPAIAPGKKPTGYPVSKQYPNRGVKTGPAWRAVWQLLCDAPGPVLGSDLDFVGASASGASQWTVKLLLTRARARGVLEVDRPLIDSRARAVYRITGAPEGEPVDVDWVLNWMILSGVQRLRDAALAEKARAS